MIFRLSRNAIPLAICRAKFCNFSLEIMGLTASPAVKLAGVIGVVSKEVKRATKHYRVLCLN